MRNFDATLWTEYQKRILHQFFMLELQYNATDRLRITETDIDVWHGGERFLSRGFKFDNLAGSGSLQVDNLDIDIDDTDQVITQILLGQDVRNTLAILYHGVVASQDVYTGSFTRTQAKISALDGYAFIDLGDAALFAKYLGGKFKIIVRDSSGNELVGYIKAAGTGETYSSNIISNGTFDSAITPWAAGNSASISLDASGQSGSCLKIIENGKASPYSNYAGYPMPLLGLYRWNNAYVKAGTATQYRIYSVGTTPDGITSWQTATSSWTAVTAWDTPGANATRYFTKNYGGAYCNFVLLVNAALGAGTYMFFDEVSISQVLTPAATGVTIVSEIDGTTQNWTSKSSSFNYYDANGYTCEIINEGILPVDVTPSYRKKQVIAEEFMRFIVGGWSLSEDNVARLNLTNELVLWNKKCLRQQSSSCQWVFKGVECAYAGSETWCDQSYERCKNLGNELRFIGARFIPALAKTALWWGRTPNYAGD